MYWICKIPNSGMCTLRRGVDSRIGVGSVVSIVVVRGMMGSSGDVGFLCNNVQAINVAFRNIFRDI